MQYDSPREVYFLHLDHTNREITLKYGKDILMSEERYKKNLSDIMESIDRCIKKTYNIATE